MDQEKSTIKVWYITGCSGGLGLNLVNKLLESPFNRVAATTRSPTNLQKKIPIEFSNNILIIKSDVTNNECVKNSIEKTIQTFGKIDFIVNNAGYGLIGSIEELSDEEYRKSFDVNVFGVLNVIRNVVPYLRRQGSGTIFNISSIFGWTTIPEFSAYVNGLTYSLNQELNPFGINLVLVSPSGFKSDFFNTGMVIAKKEMEEYKTKECIKLLDETVNNALGDPDRFSEVIIEISKMQSPPKNIFMGSESVKNANQILLSHLKELNDNKSISSSMDFKK
ncbi:hypothetical protein ACTA71_004427 [Dictyostelium dimigraforme]